MTGLDTAPITRSEYEDLLARIEDVEDAMAAMALEARLEAQEGPSDTALPAALVRRMLAGESMVRIWREHRGLEISELATSSGVPVERISSLETSGSAVGTADGGTLKALAEALRVTIDDLL